MKADPKDLTLGELMSLHEFSQRAALTYWQAKRLADTGKVQSVRLPGNRRAVVRASVEKYLEAVS